MTLDGRRAVITAIAVLATVVPTGAHGGERPCGQRPPDADPTYTDGSGNRYYAGETTGVWGNSNWYLYADGDSVEGRGTVDNLGTYVAADRRCLYAYGYIDVGSLPSTPDPVTGEPALACDDESWTAGVVEICDGTLVYRDYVYDDYGANTGQQASSTGTLAVPAGDVRYPAGDVNSADLLALKLTIQGGLLHVSFELNSLFRADSTTATIAIDNVPGGGGAWADASVPPVRSDGWDLMHSFSAGSPGSNVIEGTVPLPSGDTWRLQAITAQAGGPAMNVAFRGTRETGTWWDANQATALRDGDVSAFGHVVSVADLAPGVTRTYGVRPGLYERVYTSDYTVPPGEGVSYDGVPGRNPGGGYFAQKFHYLGRHQPYALYVPDAGGPHGLQLVLHGHSVNHSGQVTQAGFRADMADLRNRILAAPLGRGPAGFYSDHSERDVLDVLDDVLRLYDVDRDRVFVSGYSMGGYGAYRMAMLHPDLFAGFISWVGGTGDAFNGTPVDGSSPGGSVGNVIDFVGNVRHVPGAMLYAGADELVWANNALAMADRFASHQIPYVLYEHPAAEHFTFALADDWLKESNYSKDLTVVRAPARVTYRMLAGLGNAELDIAHDRAYWVSAIRARADAYADVDLTTGGCGGTLATTRPTNGAGPAPVPWVSQGAEVYETSPVTQTSLISGTLSNVASLTIDEHAACVGAGATYAITTDGPVVISLGDGRRADLSEAGTFSGTFA